MKHKSYILLSLIVLASMFLAACGPGATEPPATEPPALPPTQPPAPTEPPVAACEPAFPGWGPPTAEKGTKGINIAFEQEPDQAFGTFSNMSFDRLDLADVWHRSRKVG